MKKILTILALLFSVTACTDAQFGYLRSYGESQDVSCFSGGQEVFKAKTTGKVKELEGGGWAFTTSSGEYVQTYADCFVSYKIIK